MSRADEAKPATEKDPRTLKAYAYFRVHLSEIAAWIEGGCSVRSVWRAYAERASQPFPGSYSSFLRYCHDHRLAPRRSNERGKDAAKSSGVAPPPQRPDAVVPKRGPLRGPKSVASANSARPSKIYPAPASRPREFIPSEEDWET